PHGARGCTRPFCLCTAAPRVAKISFPPRGGQASCSHLSTVVETRMLILNADPVFQDRALVIFDMMDDVETRIVRTMAEAVFVLLAENFDVFVVEGEKGIAF